MALVWELLSGNRDAFPDDVITQKEKVEELQLLKQI